MKIIFDKLEKVPPYDFCLRTWDKEILKFWLWNNGISTLVKKLEYNDCYSFYSFDMFPDECFWQRESYEELSQKVNGQKDRLSEILQKDGYKFEFRTTYWWHTDKDENPCLPGLKRQIPGWEVWVYPMDSSMNQIDNFFNKG